MSQNTQAQPKEAYDYDYDCGFGILGVNDTSNKVRKKSLSQCTHIVETLDQVHGVQYRIRRRADVNSKYRFTQGDPNGKR